MLKAKNRSKEFVAAIINERIPSRSEESKFKEVAVGYKDLKVLFAQEEAAIHGS